MNYSHWTDSFWFTFWSNDSPNNIFKKDQLFEISDVPGIQFSYEELKNDIDSCLNKVKLHYYLEKEILINEKYYVNRKGELVYFEKKINKKPIKLKDFQLEELKEYMLKFLKDVDNDNSLI